MIVGPWIVWLGEPGEMMGGRMLGLLGGRCGLDELREPAWERHGGGMSEGETKEGQGG